MQQSENAGLARWRGKTALVTGASAGIGRAVALRLARAGLDVMAAARREQRLTSLAAELAAGEASGDGPECGAIHPLVLDVRDETSIEDAFRRCETLRSGPDVLVNAAGLGYAESLLDGDAARFREMLDVNVLGLTLVTRAAVRSMRARGTEGHVFHLGSLSGHRIPPGSNMYGATKFAVRSLTESLRVELHAARLPIRVTAISPGFVETEFHRRYFDSETRATELYRRYRVLSADDVADTVVYALGTPPHVQVHDLLVRSLQQPS